MSYQRVIPRDLFNEANLLKCYGQVCLNLERLNLPHVELTQSDDGSFEVYQDPDSGALTLDNVGLHAHGKGWKLTRPLNARAPYPLYVESISDPDFDPVDVFNDDGTFSASMLHFLGTGT